MFPAGRSRRRSRTARTLTTTSMSPTTRSRSRPGQRQWPIGYPDLVEGGKRKNSYRDSLRIITAGQALLVVLQSNVNADSLPGLYLMIDGVCPLTTVFPRRTRIPRVSARTSNFGVTPGTHTLGVITAKRGFGLLNCAWLKPGPTTAITVEAGHRYVVLVYGLTKDGFRILTAPIAGQ